jgi:hypothetical protein
LPLFSRYATFTGMYVVTEADATAIREAYETGGSRHRRQRHGQGAGT